MRAKARILGFAFWILLIARIATAADEKAASASGLDKEGFLQRWLLLLPIPMSESETGVDAIDKQQIKDEAKLKPKVGDKIAASGKELAWKAHNSKDFQVDFNEILSSQTENSIAYAFTLVVAPGDLPKVKMKLGTNDEAKIYLNGKEVYKNVEQRPTQQDQDVVEVALKKGVNILVAKIINDTNDWSFCVRFTDKSDKPLTNLILKTAE